MALAGSAQRREGRGWGPSYCERSPVRARGWRGVPPMGGSGVDIALDLLLPPEQQGPDRKQRIDRGRVVSEWHRGGDYLCSGSVTTMQRLIISICVHTVVWLEETFENILISWSCTCAFTSDKWSGFTTFAGYRWILSNTYQNEAFSCCAAPNHPLRAYTITAAGSTAALALITGKYCKLCTWVHATENLLTRTIKRCLVKYKKEKGNGGLWLCDWPTRINRTGCPAWNVCALDFRFVGDRNNAAVVAISPLTLFVICLQALICFTDVARAPPPPLLWPNV